MAVKHALWTRPQHHLDMDHAHDHVHWSELFYDLVHVVVIFTLGNLLSHHVDWPTLGLVTALFVAAWFAWGDAAVFNSMYVSTDVGHRAWTALLIATVMLMAVGMARVSEDGWPIFAGAYALNRFAVGVLYARVRWHHGAGEQVAAEMARNFMLLAVVFAIAALLPKPASWVAFVVGLVLMQGVYMWPRVSPLRLVRFRPRVGHITERFALMLLIVLGEGLFKLALSYAQQSTAQWSGLSVVAMLCSTLGLFALAWIYFDFVGFAEPKDWRKRAMVSWWLAHLSLMWSAFVLAVGLSGVVDIRWDQAMPKPLAWLGAAGAVGFLLSTLVIRQASAPKPVHRYATPGVVGWGLAFVALAMVAVYANRPGLSLLAWILVMLSQIALPMWRRWRAPEADIDA